MTAEELRTKTPEQLREALVDQKKAQFNLRFQMATGRVENTAEMRKARRNAARIKTILNQKAAEAAGSAE
ncbi:MAG: 50S ribosomal protein L29 [Neomegalonema sp.]|nr:50S ribosomal protein L29 [Neomegalonema sp.]